MSKRVKEAALKALPDYSPDGKHKVDLTLDRLLYQQGYEQAEAETIERACEWLFAHLTILVDYYNEDIHENADRSEFIKLFRKQMEEG